MLCADVLYKEFCSDIEIFIKKNLMCNISFDGNDESDIYIIVTDDIREFWTLYDEVPDSKKNCIMLLTNNVHSDYIIMCLKFVNYITYIKMKIKFDKLNLEYKNYKIKNIRRIVKNILNFCVFKGKYTY